MKTRQVRREFTAHDVGRTRGQSLAEFALVVPVLLLLLLIAIDFGRVYLGWVNLQNMARIAANYAANQPLTWNTAAFQNQISNDAKATNCDLVSFPTPSFSATTVGGTVRVDISCTFHPITPVISGILGSGVTVSASSVFPVKSSIVPAEGGCPLATPKFLASPNSGVPNLTIFAFDGTSSTGNPQTYTWNFGDPGSGSLNVATGPTANHVYSTAGAFAVSLTVINVCGSRTATQKDVVVVSNAGFCIVPNFIDTGSLQAQTLWASRGFSSTVAFGHPNKLPYAIKSQSLASGIPALCNSPITVDDR